MQLIDGYNGGVAHITASMIRDHNLSLYGADDCVLPVGNKFSYEVVDNNTIRINDGMAVIGGARAIIEYGQQETATIENGVAGYMRNDIIAIEYSKDNESLVESAVIKVIKGELGSSGVDPELVDGDVRAGATVRQMALYRVNVNGLSIESVDTLWNAAVFPILSGGTGANNAEDARSNLGVKSYITQTLTSGSYTVSASTYKVVDFTTPIIDGYTPIGIISVGNGTYELALIDVKIINGNARVVVRNVTASSKTFTLSVTVLYEES